MPLHSKQKYFSHCSNKLLKQYHQVNCLAALVRWIVNAGSEMFGKTVGWSRQFKHRRMNAGRNIREKSKSTGEHITQRTECYCAARHLLPKKLVEQSTSERGAGFSCCCWWGGAGVLITRWWEEGKHIHQLHSWLHTQTGMVASQMQGMYLRFESGYLFCVDCCYYFHY